MNYTQKNKGMGFARVACNAVNKGETGDKTER